jgi:dTDP-4-amino-4,6-dideoxygalactose transaminase
MQHRLGAILICIDFCITCAIVHFKLKHYKYIYMIPVTKPFLPNIKKYNSYINSIWSSEQLTNSGPLVQELESKLKNFCETQHLFFVSNGTIALQLAIKALNLRGEIITTPFSYVATTSSIVWEGCSPVFVDIDPKSLTIDTQKIVDAITPTTSAILVTHVYGNPCNLDEIQKIANNYNLKIIYDAAHCFGVKYKNIPIVNYGDISTLSFHATKLFHTVEGGAIIVNNSEETAHKISYMRNFGHDGQVDYFGLGINGKNSEMHAAMGLCNLPEISGIIANRKMLSAIYDSAIQEYDGKITRPEIRSNTDYNYAYYPILFENEKLLLTALEQLNTHNIFPRRYFYPSLTTLNYVKHFITPIANDISTRVLCLPLYHSLSTKEVYEICAIIKKVL